MGKKWVKDDLKNGSLSYALTMKHPTALKCLLGFHHWSGLQLNNSAADRKRFFVVRWRLLEPRLLMLRCCRRLSVRFGSFLFSLR